MILADFFRAGIRAGRFLVIFAFVFAAQRLAVTNFVVAPTVGGLKLASAFVADVELAIFATTVVGRRTLFFRVITPALVYIASVGLAERFAVDRLNFAAITIFMDGAVALVGLARAGFFVIIIIIGRAVAGIIVTCGEAKRQG
jgi:hypothetical protein